MSSVEKRHGGKRHTSESPLAYALALAAEGTSRRIAGKLSPLVGKLAGRERVHDSTTSRTRRGAGVCVWTARVDRVLMFALLLLFCSCASTKQYPAGSFTIGGVMHRTNIEGGCWVFRTADGQSYELTGEAAKDLLREGLRAEIVVKPRRDVMSICMVGKIVEVIEIKEIQSDSSPR